ncbi:KH domain-containing protein, putative isoform 2 [Hibiscus syriacus]|uniref:KH domain-containing protein, putative isoform 2 n=1 Tax=Hibiscus syriacus TaxID=106335 RepID=A0A6A3B4C0_HIBSY|nr:KH domain-containing protein, putative isoform 2 [Hibiscus syriacus]
MADQEVVVTAAPGHVPSDHKRKLEDIEPQAPPDDMPLGSDAEDNDVAASGSSETKRSKLVNDETDGLEDQFGDKFRSLIKVRVGNGESINFWNGKLKEFGEFRSSIWSWHVHLRRNLSDWELEQFSDLMAIIHNITLSHDLSDGLIWKGNGEVVLWTIWKTRNDIVFDGGRVDQIELFFMARCRLANWFLAKFNDVTILKDYLISDPTLGDCCSNPRLSIIKIVSWSPPPKGFIKLNVDAAVNGDWRKSGVGGILRVEDGSVMGSFQEAAGPGPPLLIEIMALKKGLSFFALIHQRFKERLIVESDSKLAVEWVPRSANVEADSLAKAANWNGFEAEKLDEPGKQEDEPLPQNEFKKQSEDGNAPSEGAQTTVKHISVEGTTEETEQQSIDNHEASDAELGKVESFEAYNGHEPLIKDESEQQFTGNLETTDGDLGKVESFEADGGQEPPSKEESNQPSDEVPPQNGDDGSTITRKMEVPKAKVGVLIGKAGDTIRYLQYNSGAKIQITKDADADRDAPTRPVEIIGSLASVIKAETLINAVIEEVADTGGSPSLVARGLATTQAAGAADQIEIQVPNEKVRFIIGRGGETIRGLQTRSGARIQLIPQHLPEGDESKERIVRVTGDKRQIEIAREMIKDVMNQNARSSSLSGGFNQLGNRPRGTTGPPQWGSRSRPAQMPSYDFQQRRPYPPQNSHYQPPYGGYPHQMAPRSNFGSSWVQRPHSLQGPPHSGGYDYYSRQGSVPAPHLASIRGHGPGPTHAPAMGLVSSQSNYNHGQPHGPSDYAHPPPYSHAAPLQHSYGHGYGEKFESHTPVHHPYGGHGSSQQGYAHSGPQPVYGPPQQQYVKTPSAMQQPLIPQAYGPPANQPGEVPYEGPSGQSYGPNVPPQQQYPYASGPMQQSYPPYGSAPPSNWYNQIPPMTGQPLAYSQQGGQPVPGYSQPSAQQATAYAHPNSAAGYGQYPPPSQQGYSEQTAPNTAYGLQGTQDSSYGAGAVTTYGAAPGGQATYPYSTAAQATYMISLVDMQCTCSILKNHYHHSLDSLCMIRPRCMQHHAALILL